MNVMGLFLLGKMRCGRCASMFVDYFSGDVQINLHKGVQNFRTICLEEFQIQRTVAVSTIKAEYVP